MSECCKIFARQFKKKLAIIIHLNKPVNITEVMLNIACGWNLCYKMAESGPTIAIRILFVGEKIAGPPSKYVYNSSKPFLPPFPSSSTIITMEKTLTINDQQINLILAQPIGQLIYQTARHFDIIVIVFYTKDSKSFRLIHKSVKELADYELKSEFVVFGILSNQDDEQVISRERAQIVADDYGLRYFEVRLDGNIGTVLQIIVQDALERKYDSSKS